MNYDAYFARVSRFIFLASALKLAKHFIDATDKGNEHLGDNPDAGINCS
jgi:hypothetical protein